MATMIEVAAFIAAAKELREYIQTHTVPYVPGGMTLAGMDCQGMMEYLLMQCGLAKKTVNLAGSNAHWRNSLKWSGTPEEAIRQFGYVPFGAWMFIWDEVETAKYADDDDGNASHVGVYIDDGETLNASGSNECVCISTKFKGKRSVSNGGWNRVGLPKWVRFSADIEAKLGNSIVVKEDDFMSALYDAKVITSGGHLNIRSAPRKGGTDIGDIPNGALLQVLEETNTEWVRVFYEGTEGYVMREFLSMVGDPSAVVSDDDAALVPTTGTTYGVFLPCTSLEAAQALRNILQNGAVKRL